jgi:hypothetical protein
MAKNEWFTVDKEGLAKLLERRGGKSFVVFELIQNGWDENSTRVDVILEPIENRAACLIKVTDDNPTGFSDLSHAFTLFAESKKKKDPEKRGRFNLGEKLVLACCEEAKIITTTGTVSFDKDGVRRMSSLPKNKTENGSVFTGIIRMTRAEYTEVCQSMQSLIPPRNITTTFNGKELQPRKIIGSFEAKLLTDVENEEGNLIRTKRMTYVEMYDVLPGEVASIYEMGLPVVETGDKYHLNVGQKVPVNIERDNVPPSYLRSLRTFALNQVFNSIQGTDEANKTWVRDALEDKNISGEAVKWVIKERFGEKAVIYDPSDPEGSKIAASKGMTVVPGGSFSEEAWGNIKQHGALVPAGQVTPSPKPYSEFGDPLNLIPQSEWTEGMNRIANYASMLAKKLMNFNIGVQITNDVGWPFAATYGPSGNLVLNVGRLGKAFFTNFPHNFVEVTELMIHEFGHHYSLDHLSEEYHDALSRLGAKLAQLIIERPEMFSFYTTMCTTA